MSDTERLAAGMICGGFDGPAVDDHVRGLIGRGVRNVILFERNVESPGQVRELVSELRALTDEPLTISVDQEGGRIVRLTGDKGFAVVPPMREVDDAAAAGETLGRACRDVGIDLNFAPVLDVDTNPANPVIGEM